jgi:mRNA interferase HigB
MRVIAKRTLRDFWSTHPDCEQALRSWYQEAEAAEWSGPIQIKARYPTASFLRDSRVVFNISGNRYRLIVKIRYEFGLVYVPFLGTYQEYEAVDARSI